MCSVEQLAQLQPEITAQNPSGNCRLQLSHVSEPEFLLFSVSSMALTSAPSKTNSNVIGVYTTSYA